MKIAEMNNCIEQMRKVYKFSDEKTEIRLADELVCHEAAKFVEVCTVDANGTQITMCRRADELVE